MLKRSFFSSFIFFLIIVILSSKDLFINFHCLCFLLQQFIVKVLYTKTTANLWILVILFLSTKILHLWPWLVWLDWSGILQTRELQIQFPVRAHFQSSHGLWLWSQVRDRTGDNLLVFLCPSLSLLSPLSLKSVSVSSDEDENNNKILYGNKFQQYWDIYIKS